MKKFAIFLISLVSFFICGFTIMNLWNWFIVPLGVMSITFWHAVGIDILITLIVTTKIPDKLEEIEELKRLTYAIMFPLLSLGFGWIAHLFM